MPSPRFRVYIGPAGGSLTSEFTNVQSVTVNTGRRSPLEAYRSNTATFTVRYPNGYASPSALVVPGSIIAIYIDDGTTNRPCFYGQVSDAEVVYGKPYSSNVGPADYLTVSCESYFAVLGRAQGNGYSLAAASLNTQSNAINNDRGFQIFAISTFGAEVPFPATTINGTFADWANLVALTFNGRIRDYGTTLSIVNQYYKTPEVFGGFSDDGTAGTSRYTEITFDSLADNYYTQVVVDPESYAEQTVQTGSSPYRTYKVNTLNSSTGQALDYANYLLSTYSDPALAISSLRVFLNDTTLNPIYGAGYESTQVSVKFRGTTYQCIVEGATFSGTPSGGIYATFHVSGADLNNYLLLDNAVYGRLDFNKLGY